jgi:AraC-like DNA-binding protein
MHRLSQNTRVFGVQCTRQARAGYGELSLTESFDFGDMRPFVLEAAVHVSRLIAAVAGEDLEAAAQELDISPRTLIRRLKAKGLRYRDLADEARAKLVGWRLAHTSNPAEQIVVELGYGDPSNFSRTFRRWRGVTPSEFRRRAATDGSTPMAGEG